MQDTGKYKKHKEEKDKLPFFHMLTVQGRRQGHRGVPKMGGKGHSVVQLFRELEKGGVALARRLPGGGDARADSGEVGTVRCEVLGGSIFQGENTLSQGMGWAPWGIHAKGEIIA